MRTAVRLPETRPRSRVLRAVRLAAALLASALLFLHALAPAARMTLAPAETAAVDVAREAERAAALAALHGWPQLQTEHFRVYYEPGLAADARLSAETAERYFPQVAADFGLPAGPWPLVVLSTDQMCGRIGCPGDVPPLGAYAKGIVWLLAPSAYLPEGPDAAADFAASGPVPHELTHLADDLRSGGRVPAWLDEGLAQYEEWRLAGYVWVQPDNGFDGPLYSWNQLTTDFVHLPNQALAYRQALAVTAALCRRGPGTCVAVLDDLRRGASVEQALERAVGAATLSAWQAGGAWRPGDEPAPGQPVGPKP